MSSKCDTFAEILMAEKSDNPGGVCLVQRMRDDIQVEVLGRITHSPTVLLAMFSYEDVDNNGNALCLGEFLFKQTEVRTFLNTLLSNHDIRVTAIHNHWLFDNPRLIYIHWEAIMEPLKFAKISAHALDMAIGM
ncbi:MAG: DUF1259 domain-containing protein [Chitinophagales bacterium]